MDESTSAPAAIEKKEELPRFEIKKWNAGMPNFSI